MKQHLPMTVACALVGAALYFVPDVKQPSDPGPVVHQQHEPSETVEQPKPNVVAIVEGDDLRPIPMTEPLPVQAEPVTFVPPALARPQVANVQVVDWRPDTENFTGAVVYGAEWCKWCHLLERHLRHVADRKETGDWRFSTTERSGWKDADWVGHDCTDHGPKGLPLVEFYVAGQLVDSMRGYNGTTERLKTIWNLHPRTRKRDAKPYQTSQRAKAVKATPASYTRTVNLGDGSSDPFTDAVAAPAAASSGGKVQVEVSGTIRLEGSPSSYSEPQRATTRTTRRVVESAPVYVAAAPYATDTTCTLSYSQPVATSYTYWPATSVALSYPATTYSYSYSQPATSYATSYRVGPVGYSYPASGGTFTSYRRGLFWNRTSSIGPGGYSYQYNGLLSGTRGFRYSTGGGAYGTQNCANGVCW